MVTCDNLFTSLFQFTPLLIIFNTISRSMMTVVELGLGLPRETHYHILCVESREGGFLILSTP